MSNYDSVRRQCRTIENLIDNKLSSYSRLVSPNNDDLESGLVSERRQDLEAEIEDLLEQLRDANDRLSNEMVELGTPASSSQQHSIQRHKEVLQGHIREYQQTKRNVQKAFDQASLLGNIRNDISAYKSSTSDTLLSERGRIDSSHRMIDDITSQAHETRAEFGRQRTTLDGINSRMGTVMNQMPGIGKVIDLIRSRRRRDALIIGVVSGLCLLGILSYISR